MQYNIYMKVTQSYGVKFKGGYKAIKRTIVIFNDAVNYLITPVQDHYDDIPVAVSFSGSNKIQT